MDRCTGRRDITETLLKAALNTIQSIQSFNPWGSELTQPSFSVQEKDLKHYNHCINFVYDASAGQTVWTKDQTQH